MERNSAPGAHAAPNPAVPVQQFLPAVLKAQAAAGIIVLSFAPVGKEASAPLIYWSCPAPAHIAPAREGQGRREQEGTQNA